MTKYLEFNDKSERGEQSISPFMWRVRARPRHTVQQHDWFWKKTYRGSHYDGQTDYEQQTPNYMPYGGKKQ